MSHVLRVAVIGTGAIVERAHLPTLVSMSDVAVARIVGRDSGRAGALAARFGASASTSDPFEAVSDPAIDAVVIAHHNAGHATIAVAALRNGKHVFCEKPLAIDIAEMDAVGAALTDSHDRVFALNHGLRRLPAIIAIRKAAAAGEFGELRTMHLSFRRRRGIPGLGSWFTRRVESGGGALFDLGSHMADLAVWIAGDPAGLAWGETWADHGPRGVGGGDWGRPMPDGKFDVDDRAMFGWRSVQGTRVTIDVAWACHGAEGLRLDLIGSRGGALYVSTPDLADAEARLYHENHLKWSETSLPPTSQGEAIGAIGGGAANFVRACRGESVDLAGFGTAAAVLRVLVAVRDFSRRP